MTESTELLKTFLIHIYDQILYFVADDVFSPSVESLLNSSRSSRLISKVMDAPTQAALRSAQTLLSTTGAEAALRHLEQHAASAAHDNAAVWACISELRTRVGDISGGSAAKTRATAARFSPRRTLQFGEERQSMTNSNGKMMSSAQMMSMMGQKRKTPRTPRRMERLVNVGRQKRRIEEESECDDMKARREECAKLLGDGGMDVRAGSDVDDMHDLSTQTKRLLESAAALKKTA